MTRFLGILARLSLIPLCVAIPQFGATLPGPPRRDEHQPAISPKVFIISMWSPEASVWYDRFHESGLGNLTAQAIWTPGISMAYPRVYCTADGTVCQATVGEGEINAASTMTAIALSSRFDLRSTYFLFAGIAGVNPRHATLGGVALARYSVQVALQYELDARSVPDGWPTGYFAYGSDQPNQYPSIIYGTEVFELNAALRDVAYTWARRAELSDAEGPRTYRAKYESMGEVFAAAVGEPRVVRCDTATSDVYYSGKILSEAFENTTSVWTNGTGVYCMTAQEDSANLEVMVRAAIEGLVDFSRIIVMRTGSNFDRPPPGISDWEHLALSEQNGFNIALENMYNAGIVIVSELLHGWNCTFAQGVKPENYIGDIFGSLGGSPGFGPGSRTGGSRVAPAGGRAAEAGESGKDESHTENLGSQQAYPRQRKVVRHSSPGKRC